MEPRRQGDPLKVHSEVGAAAGLEPRAPSAQPAVLQSTEPRPERTGTLQECQRCVETDSPRAWAREGDNEPSSEAAKENTESLELHLSEKIEGCSPSKGQESGGGHEHPGSPRTIHPPLLLGRPNPEQLGS